MRFWFCYNRFVIRAGGPILILALMEAAKIRNVITTSYPSIDSIESTRNSLIQLLQHKCSVVYYSYFLFHYNQFTLNWQLSHAQKNNK